MEGVPPITIERKPARLNTVSPERRTGAHTTRTTAAAGGGHVTGADVTDQYADLEARLHSNIALRTSSAR